MSPRTLQRRLREEGTSWREELEKLRQRRVERLLRETSLSVESIAARIGFPGPRAPQDFSERFDEVCVLRRCVR
jgi:transcriptional regulator GlxA family with amidase domain